MNTLTAHKAHFQSVNLFFHKLYEKYTVFKSNYLHQKADSDFTFDLDAMKNAVNQPKIKINKTDAESDESFDKWLND